MGGVFFQRAEQQYASSIFKTDEEFCHDSVQLLHDIEWMFEEIEEKADFFGKFLGHIQE